MDIRRSAGVPKGGTGTRTAWVWAPWEWMHMPQPRSTVCWEAGQLLCAKGVGQVSLGVAWLRFAVAASGQCMGWAHAGCLLCGTADVLHCCMEAAGMRLPGQGTGNQHPCTLQPAHMLLHVLMCHTRTRAPLSHLPLPSPPLPFNGFPL